MYKCYVLLQIWNKVTKLWAKKKRERQAACVCVCMRVSVCVCVQAHVHRSVPRWALVCSKAKAKGSFKRQEGLHRVSWMLGFVAWCQSKVGPFVCTGPCRRLRCPLFRGASGPASPDGYSPQLMWTNPPSCLLVSFSLPPPLAQWILFWLWGRSSERLSHMDTDTVFLGDSFPLVTITASGFYYRCLYNHFHII